MKRRPSGFCFVALVIVFLSRGVGFWTNDACQADVAPTLDVSQKMIRARLEALQNVYFRYYCQFKQDENVPGKDVVTKRLDSVRQLVFDLRPQVAEGMFSRLNSDDLIAWSNYDVIGGLLKESRQEVCVATPGYSEQWTYTPRYVKHKSRGRISRVPFFAPFEEQFDLAGLGLRGLMHLASGDATLLRNDDFSSMKISRAKDGNIILSREERDEREQWTFQPDAGFALVNYKILGPPDFNTVEIDVNSSEFENAGGLMLPRNISARAFFSDESKYVEKERYDYILWEYVVGASDNTEERYRIRYPESAEVLDTRIPIAYTFGKDGLPISNSDIYEASFDARTEAPENGSSPATRPAAP